MPKPNSLPQIDWPRVFATASDFDAWLARGIKPENQQKMRERRESWRFTPQVHAWLTSLPRDVHVLIIAEDWCPDVIRHVPILQAMGDVSGRIKPHYIMLTDHPDVLARFLTNGGESVPKMGFFNDGYVQCGMWGPMPESCNELIRRGRAASDLRTARERVAHLYDADPGCREAIDELMHCLEIAASS